MWYYPRAKLEGNIIIEREKLIRIQGIIRPAEKQGRNSAEHEKGKPQNFPVFAYSDIYFPVFLPFLVDLTLYEYKNAKNFGASRRNGQIPSFCQISDRKNREEI